MIHKVSVKRKVVLCFILIITLIIPIIFHKNIYTSYESYVFASTIKRLLNMRSWNDFEDTVDRETVEYVKKSIAGESEKNNGNEKYIEEQVRKWFENAVDVDYEKTLIESCSCQKVSEEEARCDTIFIQAEKKMKEKYFLIYQNGRWVVDFGRTMMGGD